MIEAEWNSCTDPQKMREWLRHSGKATERKLRLFAIACARRVCEPRRDEAQQIPLLVAEAFADGQVSHAELAKSRNATASYTSYAAAPNAMQAVTRVVRWARECAFWSGPATVDNPAGWNKVAWQAESQPEVALWRDICGNPFHPVSLDTGWRTPTVLALAQRAYDDRHLPESALDPVLLSALADALEAAGCDSNELLGHLRSPRPHVRGCLALDLILAEE